MRKDGGGGLAGAQLVLRSPGSSGSGLQWHQEPCQSTRGSEGTAQLGGGTLCAHSQGVLDWGLRELFRLRSEMS